MAIPLASTTITVERREQPDEAQPAEQDQDPWDTGYSDEPTETVYKPIAEGVRAVISVGGGQLAGREVGPGVSEVVSWSLICDPTDLTYLDQVVDEYDGTRYLVEFAITSPGIGGKLSSTRAGLSTRKGA
jgi:hypothetical protein